MNRSPLFYPLARSMDSEAGGAADLQTDVMRFMAILSLCLMAIFALLQTVPAEPLVASSSTPVESRPEVRQKSRLEVSPEARPEARLEVSPDVKPEPAGHQQETRIAPITTKVAKSKPVPVNKPIAKPTPAPPVPAAKAPTPSAIPEPTVPPSDAPAGFTFRFDSDHALTGLVARNTVGLYAITDGQALRMTLNRDKAEFWSASLPQQYHEMDASTVPESVIRALRSTRGGDAADTRWGVTLPSSMTTKLRQLMRDNRSGAVIIGVDGDLRLEP